jgi:hypothetical protein
MNANGSLCVLAVLIAGLAAAPLHAQTKLTDFSGEWHGSGTDRNSPIESTGPTVCRMMVQADDRRMTSETRCDSKAGLRKVLHLTIVLDGEAIKGQASQTSTPRGRATADMSGSVTGQKTGDAATLTVRFPGLTPNATVLLRRPDLSSFTMTVFSVGFTLMDVTFRRTPGS